jgi:uncharacterized protein
MKCENCKSSNVRRSSWKRNENDRSHFIYAPYRCRDCEHRFFAVSRTFIATIIGGLGLVVFFGLIVGLYWVSNGTPIVAQANPAVSHEMDPIKKALLNRAAKGSAADQYEAGMMYLRGDEVPQNFKEAMKWFELASYQGHGQSELNLGLLYKGGRGVLQDYKAAALWLEKAARLGLPEAQYQLGTLYKAGQGVKHDTKQAYVWYNVAAAQGYEPATAARDTIAGFMNAAEIADAQAMARTILVPGSAPATEAVKPVGEPAKAKE